SCAMRSPSKILRFWKNPGRSPSGTGACRTTSCSNTSARTIESTLMKKACSKSEYHHPRVELQGRSSMTDPDNYPSPGASRHPLPEGEGRKGAVDFVMPHSTRI